MAAKKGGLGKGLDSLIPGGKTNTKSKITNANLKTNKESNTSSSGDGTIYVKTSLVQPDVNQPRKEFNKDSLNELADSIKKLGIVQPLVVTQKSGSAFYQLIAGERRLRAAKLAGLKEVPVVIGNYTDQEMAEISIIENIQREDLNPIEEAMAYQRLIDEFHLTQEEVSEKVSKSRVSITNSLRLLKLSPKVQDLVIEGTLSFGHARTILAINDYDKQLDIANEVIARKLSVRETEKLINDIKNPSKSKGSVSSSTLTSQQNSVYKEMEEKLKEALGSKVSIKAKNSHKGKIEIEYYSPKDLEAIYTSLVSIKEK